MKIEYFQGPNPGIVPRLGKDPTPRNYNGMDLSRWNVGDIRDLPSSIAHSFLRNGNFREAFAPAKVPATTPEAPVEKEPTIKKKG